MDFIGPIKVNLEFSFSFSGFSFSGLNPTFSGFKPEIYLIHISISFYFLICQQLLIVSLGFSSRLICPTQCFDFFSRSLDQQSRIWVIFLRFQNSGFPFPVSLPRVIFHFPGFQILDPRKANFWFTLIGPMWIHSKTSKAS